MSHISLYILGCGAAKPTIGRFSSAQVLDIRNRQFMIDCGEGCQIRLGQMHLGTARLNHIFISHLHGDHCFGLPGLLSSLAMDGRTAPIYIHAHAPMKQLLGSWLDFFCADMPYQIVYEEIKAGVSEVVYEDNAVRVTSIPLRHRIPASGFLFEEKPGERHLRRDVCDAYQIPLYAFNRIKQGEDYLLPDGRVIANERLTSEPSPCLSYAYCTDTRYNENIVPLIKGCSLLYHDSTYDDGNEHRAEKYFHSTAREAATIASKAHVGRLLLGHFSNRIGDANLALRQAREVFANTDIAQDLKKIEI